MRLIDADRLLDIMKQERDRISDTYGENDEYVRCLNTYAISMVLNAPTIEEPKTGRWNRMMMHLADLQLTYAPADGHGDAKLYEFVSGLIEELEGWSMEVEHDS